MLPRGKQGVAWVGREHPARQPRMEARRARPLRLSVHRQAPEARPAAVGGGEVFRGKPTTTVGVEPGRAARRRRPPTLLIVAATSTSSMRRPTVVTPTGRCSELALPDEGHLVGLVDGRVIVAARRGLDRRPATHLRRRVAGVARPRRAHGATRRISSRAVDLRAGAARVGRGAARDAHGLLVADLDNVRGRVLRLHAAADGGWTRQAIACPTTLSVDVAAADPHGSDAFFDVDRLPDADQPCGSPTRDAGARARSRRCRRVRRLERHGRAVRGDLQGRDQVPYFVVHPKAMKLDGSNPTLLYAYGGFQVSSTPSYSATDRQAVAGAAAASMCWPTSAAAASSGRPGTRPA